MTHPSLTLPNLAAVPPGPTESAPLPRPSGGGVLLSRLLEIGRLTPLQAVAVAADVLTEATGRTGVRGTLRPEQVRIGMHGRARLTTGDDETAGDGADQLDDQPDDLPDLTPVLAALTDAAHRSAPYPGAVAHLAALDKAGRMVEDRTVEALRDAAVALRSAAGLDIDTARVELARLVAVATGHRVLRPAAPVRVVNALPKRPLIPRGLPNPAALARSVFARTWRWGVSFAVVAVVVMLEIVLLQDKINRDVELLLQAGRTGTVDTSADEPELPPVDPPAPAAAGPITSVGLRALQPCSPGEDCEVGLRVMLAPRPEPQVVNWTFQVVDRCTGETTQLPGGTLTVPAGGDRVDAVDTVPLPPGSASAVLAVTGAPAEAASDPVPIPADGGTCTPAEPAR